MYQARREVPVYSFLQEDCCPNCDTVFKGSDLVRVGQSKKAAIQYFCPYCNSTVGNQCGINTLLKYGLTKAQIRRIPHPQTVKSEARRAKRNVSLPKIPFVATVAIKPIIPTDQNPDYRKMPYSEYLKTDHWKRIAMKVKTRAGFKCQLCNRPKDLQVHHRTYERLGHELMGDLICLCGTCHGTFHGIPRL